MKRRSFLAASGLIALGAAVVPAKAALAAQRRTLDRIGFQLYTARDLMAADAEKTLNELAEIGYDEVEFAGYHDHTPAAVRAMLDQSGLEAPSAHVPIDLIRTAPDALIEAATVVGHHYLVLAWLAPPERQSLDQYRAHAELCNRFGERCRAAGIQFAYHNHEFEFEALEGRLPMDLLMSEVEPELMQVELDLYWTAFAGQDPIEFFNANAGRVALCHVKDMLEDGSMTDPGAGTIDFAATFAESELAGLRHYFVERDDALDPMVTAASAHAYLRELEF
jgi:sugar phosphate isomerase/epimerase